MSYDGVNLFAGPGGTCEGARQAGLELLGIEWDDAACATREAAGHPTLKADVAALEPLEFAPCEWLAASPPCQARSMAGKRGGEKDLQHVVRCAHELAAGNDTRGEHRARCVDERSMLVVEPLRWALALRPRQVMLEQVPPVLAEWSLFASFLQAVGYRTWAGILSAERYGVPQTRKRAILMASLDGPVHPPAPTHQAYEPGVPAERQHTLEGELEPWVSMAEALGWGGIDRPAPTIVTTRRSDKGLLVGRQLPEGEGRNIGGRNWATRNGGFAEGYERPDTEPAPTLTADGLAKGRDVWMATVRTGNFTAKNHRHERGVEYERPVDAPAPTVDGTTGKAWTVERPATTVNTTNGLAKPGHHGEDSMSHQCVRVTVEEAAILQGFTLGYPFQGSRTKQFEQVGNAVPPPLALAIFAALIADVEQSEAA